jgi:hypothetical protein
VAPSMQALQSEVSLLREHLVEGRREWEGKVAQLERDAQQAALAHQVPPTIHRPNAHSGYTCISGQKNQTHQ